MFQKIFLTIIISFISINILSSAVQPDGHIKVEGEDSFIGADIYNITGLNQTSEDTIDFSETSIFHFYFKNAGDETDTFIITADTNSQGFNGHFFDALSNGTDVSDSFFSTGYITSSLSPGQVKSFRLETTITDTTIIDGGDSVSVKITAQSENGSSTDVIIARSIYKSFYQPDIWYAEAGDSYSGNNVYSITGSNQIEYAEIFSGDTATFFVVIENDGNTADSFLVTGTDSNADFGINYYAGSSIINSYVTGTGYETGLINRNDTLLLEIKVWIKAADLYDSISISFSVESIKDNSKTDAAKFVVSHISPDSGSSIDLLIKESNDIDYIGDNHYNIYGANQVREKGILTGTTKSFIIKIENDGFQADTYTLTGTSGGSGWTVNYYNLESGGADITADITGAGYSTGRIKKDNEKYIRAEISVDASVDEGAQKWIYINAVSDGDTTYRDCVKIILGKLSVESNDWWDTAWSYRKKIIIKNNEQNQSLIDYQTKVTITSSDTNFWSNIKSDGTDIRVINNNQTDTVPFWIETFSYASENCIIWIRLKGVDDNDTAAVFIYYGNDNAIGTSDSGLTITYENIGEAGLKPDVRSSDYGDEPGAANYTNNYLEPPGVFVTDQEWNGPDHGSFVIFSQTSTNFTVSFEEYPSWDGPHSAATNCGWVAMKYGRWIIGGKKWIVGMGRSDHNFNTVNYGYTFSSKPVVTSEINTYYYPQFTGADLPGNAGRHPRMKNRTTSSIDMKIEMELSISHPNEYFSFYAVESGEVNQTYTNNTQIENGVVTVEVDAGQITFSSVFSSAPTVIGKLMTADDIAPAAIRMKNLTTSNVDAMVEEAGGATHDNELVGWTAVDRNVSIYGRKLVDNEPTVSSAYTEQLIIQPDLYGKTSSDEIYYGDGIYNVSSSLQNRGKSIDAGDSEIYLLILENDGMINNLFGTYTNYPDTFNIKGDTGVAGDWTVQYFDAITGGNEITEQITSSNGWTTGPVSTGETIIIKIIVSSNSGLTGGEQYSININCTSLTNSNSKDVFIFSTSIKAIIQKDILLRNKGQTIFNGNDVYDTSGNNQYLNQTVANNNSVEYELLIENDGNITDTTIVKGTSGNSNWVVKYYDLYSGGLEITNQIVSETGYIKTNLTIGESFPVRVAVTPLTNLSGGDTYFVYVSAISDSDGLTGDTVCLKTTVTYIEQPDGKIKEANKTSYLGNNIYNLTTDNQLDSKVIGIGDSAVFYFIAENAGNYDDTITITGDTGLGGFSVAYFDAISGGNNITNQITGVGWDTGILNKGDTHSLRIEITAGANAGSGDTINIKIIMTSKNNNTAKDIIGAEVIIPNYRFDLKIKNESDNSYIGNNIYNTNGFAQTKTQSTNSIAKYFIQLENDGNAQDTFILTTTAINSGWSAKFFDAASGGNDITASITGAGWTKSLSHNSNSVIRLELDSSSTDENSVLSFYINGNSLSDTIQKDSIKIIAGKSPVPSNIWADENFARRNTYEINNTDTEAITNYQVNIMLTANDTEFFNSIENDGHDIKFYSENNTDTLSYWYEELNFSDSYASLWIRVPVIPAQATTSIHLYYDYSAAEYDSSFTAVFDFIGEFGLVTAVDENFQNKIFSNTFSDTPLVFADDNTKNDNEKISIRLKNISTTGFDVATMEYPTAAGNHNNENIGYVAIVPGKWIVGEKKMFAGMNNTDENYTTFNYGYNFSAEPVVLSDIQSYFLPEVSGTTLEAGSHTRMTNRTTNSIEIKIEMESNNAEHINEYIGFAAIETGNFSDTHLNNVQLQTGINSVNSNQSTINFSPVFTGVPVVIANVMSEYDENNCNNRISGITNAKFDIIVENVSGISPDLHINEDIGWLTGDNGSSIYARKFVAVEPDTNLTSLLYASKPDISFSTTELGTYTGENIYSAIPENQTDTQYFVDTAIYFIKLKNNGQINDTLTVLADTGSLGFSASFFDSISGSTNITDEITSTGWQTALLSPNGSHIIRLEVSKTTAVAGDSLYLNLNAASVKHSQFVDSGRVKVIAVDPTPSDSSYITVTSPVISNGEDSSQITITILNDEGIPVPGETVSISSNRNFDTIIQPASLTNSFGICYAYVFSDTPGISVISVDTPTAVTDTDIIIFRARTIIINEIAFQPAWGDNGPGEWIELFNVSNDTIDISGWTISDNTDTFTFPANSKINSYGYYLLEYSENATAIPGDIIYGDFAPSLILSNTSDTITLKNSAVEIIDEVPYHSSWGNGNSLEKINPWMTSHLNTSWQSSLVSGGSPGSINTLRIANTNMTVQKNNALPDGTDTIAIIINAKDISNNTVIEGIEFTAVSSRLTLDNISQPQITNNNGTTTFLITSLSEGQSIISLDTPAGVSDSVVITFINYAGVDSENISFSDLPLSPGIDDTVVLSFRITDYILPDTVTSITVTNLYHTNNTISSIKNVKCFFDTNHNGILEPEIDLQFGTSAFFSSISVDTVIFIDSFGMLGTNDTVTVFISYSIDTNLITDNTNVGASVKAGGIKFENQNYGLPGQTISSSEPRTIKVTAEAVSLSPETETVSVGISHNIIVRAVDQYNNLDVDNTTNISFVINGDTAYFVSTNLNNQIPGALTSSDKQVSGNLVNGEAIITVSNTSEETVSVSTISNLTEDTAYIIFSQDASITANAISPSGAIPGIENHITLDINISNPSVANDIVDTIIITSENDTNSYVKLVKLWLDVNKDGIVQPTIDTYHDSGLFENDTIVFTKGFGLGDAGVRVLFTYDIDTYPLTDNASIGCYIDTNSVWLNSAGVIGISEIDSINNDNNNDYIKVDVTETIQGGQLQLLPAFNSSVIGEHVEKTIKAIDKYSNVDVDFTNTNIIITDTSGTMKITSTSMNVVSGLNTSTLTAKMSGTLNGIDTLIISSYDTGTFGLTAYVQASPPDTTTINQTWVTAAPSIKITVPANNHDTFVSSIEISGTSFNTFSGDSVGIYVNNILQETITITAENQDWNGTAELTGDNNVDTVTVLLYSIYGLTAIDSIIVTCDTVPPAKPAGIDAAAILQGSETGVLLSWTHNNENDTAGYNIYRSSAPPDFSLKITDVIITDSNYFLDTNVVQGETYFYKISCIDNIGNESEKSDSITASSVKIKLSVDTYGRTLPGDTLTLFFNYYNDGFGPAYKANLFYNIPGNLLFDTFVTNTKVTPSYDSAFKRIQLEFNSAILPKLESDSKNIEVILKIK